MENGFIREFDAPEACERAARILMAMMVNLEGRISREIQREEMMDEDWVRTWIDCVDRQANPFDEVPTSVLPPWAYAAYCYIREMQDFVTLVEAVFNCWQAECDAYFRRGIELGRKLERRNQGGGDFNLYFNYPSN